MLTKRFGETRFCKWLICCCLSAMFQLEFIFNFALHSLGYDVLPNSKVPKRLGHPSPLLSSLLLRGLL